MITGIPYKGIFNKQLHWYKVWYCIGRSHFSK